MGRVGDRALQKHARTTWCAIAGLAALAVAGCAGDTPFGSIGAAPPLPAGPPPAAGPLPSFPSLSPPSDADKSPVLTDAERQQIEAQLSKLAGKGGEAKAKAENR